MKTQEELIAEALSRNAESHANMKRIAEENAEKSPAAIVRRIARELNALAPPALVGNRPNSPKVEATKLILVKLTGSEDPPDRAIWPTGVLVSELGKQWKTLGGKGSPPGRTTIEIASHRRNLR
jgi:hypothetical protein